jgi:hypothetical protein
MELKARLRIIPSNIVLGQFMFITSFILIKIYFFDLKDELGNYTLNTPNFIEIANNAML